MTRLLKRAGRERAYTILSLWGISFHVWCINWQPNQTTRFERGGARCLQGAERPLHGVLRFIFMRWHRSREVVCRAGSCQRSPGRVLEEPQRLQTHLNAPNEKHPKGWPMFECAHQSMNQCLYEISEGGDHPLSVWLFDSLGVLYSRLELLLYRERMASAFVDQSEQIKKHMPVGCGSIWRQLPREVASEKQ